MFCLYVLPVSDVVLKQWQLWTCAEQDGRGGKETTGTGRNSRPYFENSL